MGQFIKETPRVANKDYDEGWERIYGKKKGTVSGIETFETDQLTSSEQLINQETPSEQSEDTTTYPK